ncbi:unnamed protein product, partial [Polarella glacialis]
SLFVCGGWGEDRQVRRSVERLNLEANCWELTADMSVGRYGAATAAAAGCLYILGGCDDDDEHLRSAEMLDVRLQKWTPLPEMADRRWGSAAATIFG